jgi:hypothetical protein
MLLGDQTPVETLDRRITEQIAMHAVMDAEIRLGNDPRDVSMENRGYDVESRDGNTGRLRFIEVKGRRAGAETVTITRNEILASMNAREAYILALVSVQKATAEEVRYVFAPEFADPGFQATSVNYDLADLRAMSREPDAIEW